ncbi:MAG: Pyridoxine 5'-phosphate synthase (EC [uncultured Thiotrichaceae bacterium]|uniref:Pyridoxine 5'-phosphate synthase n=1 Tax=uncultured Thiotrichaceae bacterium TaxID=298394 RepID=A0A6S6SEY8_9GAMM|nr:MAG: Pyridoxine 5'-phosphate synthase (EC [uncultured Thiotrichaceae bacterium]
MTMLSVNLNKIALLRNSRGRDFPNVVEFANKMMALGVKGITVHPRQDERHITMQDAYDLGDLLSGNAEVEYNIEGYPSEDFMALVTKIKPTQCTLVPDSPDQLTSDHGWDLEKEGAFVKRICERLNAEGIRSALFMDPSPAQIKLVPASGAKRIELYTEEYAATYDAPEHEAVFQRYRESAQVAQSLGIDLNAGHDLDLTNLAKFLTIPDILEVSIGHVLTIECIEYGMKDVIRRYLAICDEAEMTT